MSRSNRIKVNEAENDSEKIYKRYVFPILLLPQLPQTVNNPEYHERNVWKHVVNEQHPCDRNVGKPLDEKNHQYKYRTFIPVFLLR